MELTPTLPTDEYVVRALIGQGTFGQTFEAVNPAGTRVAIKIIGVTTDAVDYLTVGDVQNEVGALVALQSVPNVVKLLEVIERSDLYAVVFEYAQNTPFKELLGASNAVKRVYAKKLLTTLAEIHAKGYVHRDIKPPNVMFEMTTQEMRVIDWGTAIVYKPKEDVQGVGTLHYQAPEITLHLDFDFKVDVWSYGCLIAALFSGRDPFFDGLNPTQVFFSIFSIIGTEGAEKMTEQQKLKYYDLIHHQYGPPTLFDTFSGEFLKVLEKALVFDPEKRATARELLDLPFFKEGDTSNPPPS